MIWCSGLAAARYDVDSSVARHLPYLELALHPEVHPAGDVVGALCAMRQEPQVIQLVQSLCPPQVPMAKRRCTSCTPCGCPRLRCSLPKAMQSRASGSASSSAGFAAHLLACERYLLITATFTQTILGAMLQQWPGEANAAFADRKQLWSVGAHDGLSPWLDTQ